MTNKFPALPEPQVETFGQRVKELLEILVGVRGDKSDRAVTYQEYSKPARIGAILLNGWANYGNGHAEGGYLVFGDGRVQLFGALSPPSTFSADAFSLGRLYAPRTTVVLPAVDLVTGGNVLLTIAPVTGNVSVGATSNPISLEGLSFNRK